MDSKQPNNNNNNNFFNKNPIFVFVIFAFVAIFLFKTFAGDSQFMGSNMRTQEVGYSELKNMSGGITQLKIISVIPLLSLNDEYGILFASKIVIKFGSETFLAE